jgi:pimeloyl-ACP methyl ester carboxylesterase
MLLAHGRGITDEGMVFVAFDLPGHGGRADGHPFLDRRDPEGFAASVRQSVADVLAIVASLRCGWPLAGGVTVGRGPVRLLGYSVGSVVGSLTRAVEPDLETAVLLAPGGDLFEWIGLWLAADVEMPLQRCLGGPDAGAACRDTCAAPGVCFVNPELARLADALRVPYGQLLGSVEPMGLAGVRHGNASRGRTLLVSGGRDYVMYPELASRLADAYGMRPPSRHMRRGVHTILVEWPTLGHELSDDPRVRRQAHRFLATDGRRLEPAR